MQVERCAECGFDGGDWTDQTALDAIGRLPPQWSDAIAGLGSDALARRPVPEMWSIVEYADHVREVLFGMRFLLDSAVSQPGVELGDPPEPEFAVTPRAIDVRVALAGIDREAKALQDRLAELPAESWAATARVRGDWLDAHWIARHAVHDATHHLGDVRCLRDALG